MGTLKLVILAALAACVHLPHVDPQTRLPSDADRAAVEVYSSCVENNPLDPGLNAVVTHAEWPALDWGSHAGTGVVVSERHVLTAAHVVACPIIPTVHVRLSNGEVVRMVVEREDADSDVARLEIAAASNLDLGVAPPIFATRGYEACAVAAGHRACGHLGAPSDGTGLLEARTGPGWSGAAVYNFHGELLGLVTSGGLRTTRFVFVDASWMRGIP